MNNKFSSAVAALTTVAAFTAVPAAAHHSHVMFDLTAEQTIAGTVKSFAFQNPMSISSSMSRTEAER
jgi:hypothetical protein